MKRNLFKVAVIFILVMSFNECKTGETTKVEVMKMSLLHELDDCEEVISALKETLIDEMEGKIEANLKRVLAGDYCYPSDPWYDDGGMVMDAVMGELAVPSEDTGAEEASDEGEEASEYTKTNVQVEGVDEADFIKNDGSYIYILSHGNFKIIDAWPPSEASIISSFPVEGAPKRMFVHEDRAVIYSSLIYSGSEIYDPYYTPGDCSYGYDCDFTGDGTPLKITVLDITDKSSPYLIREVYFSGSYINSRRIGDAVFTVVSFPEIRFPELSYWPSEYRRYCPEDGAFDRAKITSAFESLKLKNKTIIKNTPIENWFPNTKDIIHQSDEIKINENILGSCKGFYKSELEDEGRNLLSVISFDLTKLDPLETTTVIGKPGAVYASRSALYIASRHGGSYDIAWGEERVKEFTSIHKFNLFTDTPSAIYTGSGIAKGRVLNQFSMDEFNGYFRIATTTGHLPDPNTHNTITILEQNKSTGFLEIVGQIDEIAPGEDIRSVRFSGERGFVVTFKKTDPLFVIDLSNPQKPAIAGELKIPGYSTYMHFIDENHILSIGFDAEEMGSFAWFTGIQLQIFDVTQMDNPTLLHKEIIGTRGTTSEAATNHLAFTYFASRKLFALPITICEGGGSGGIYGDIATFSGLLIYRVTIEDGFEKLGGINHQDSEVEDESYFACYNWWTNPNSLVKRSIFMEDYIYSIAENLIKIQDVNHLGTDVAEIDLTY